MPESSPLGRLALAQLPVTDRREFLRCTACGIAGLAALVACGGGDAATAPKTDTTIVVRHDTSTVTPTGDPKFEILGSQVKVYVSRIPELDPIPGFFLVDQASTIILHTGADQYVAFTAICTHQGCTVNGFSSATNNMICPCHGSEYNLSGTNVAGPAPSPLTQFSGTYDAATKIFLVTKTA